MSMNLSDGARFLQLMKRYCIDYVNVGDQAVTQDLMVDDYALAMGTHTVIGRDTAYFDATAALMAQYPGLMLTVHGIATSGDRLMMRFSEHGRRAKDAAICAWGGIALYRWNGEKLVHCSVEQDYWSRQRQISNGAPDPIDAPAPAPWSVTPQPPSPDAENAVRAWLGKGGLAVTPNVHCDEAWVGGPQMRALDQDSVDILDLFSAGDRVAFRVEQHGRVADDFAPNLHRRPASLHATAIVQVRDGQIVKGHVIRNRLDMGKRLAAETNPKT